MFNIFENSIFGGKPLELYEFRCGIRAWRYTNQAKNITFNGQVYEPVAGISRSSVVIAQSLDDSEMTITFKGGIDVMQQYVSIPPSEQMIVSIFQYHRGDPDNEYQTIYRGVMIGASWKENFTWVQAKFTSFDSSIVQMGLRRSYQFNCPFSLYDENCKVDRNNFRDITTVSEINGRVLTLVSVSRPDNFFRGGFLTWTTPDGALEKRWIYSSTGASVTLHITSIGLPVGTMVTAYAGCDHSDTVCMNTFNNMDNNGSTPLIPDLNPFAGAALF